MSNRPNKLGGLGPPPPCMPPQPSRGNYGGFARRPVLLDLYCCAGGAAVGYYRAGFDVVGVDKEPQPRYPFRFVCDDALIYLRDNSSMYDAVHASPPCQAFTAGKNGRPERGFNHPRLIEPTRDALRASGKPYIMENVVGAPMDAPIMLCGTMFGLTVFRHRLFESNCFLMQPPHEKHTARIGFGGFCCVAGHGDAGKNVRVPADHRTKAAWEAAMGIDWMHKPELAQAIPPVYTEFLGRQLLLNVDQTINANPQLLHPVKTGGFRAGGIR